MNQSFPQNQEEETLNLKELIEGYLVHWRWLVLSATLFLGAAWFYLRYAIPEYQSTSSILIKDDEKSGNLPGMDMFKDLGIMNGSGNLENEIEILKSRTLLTIVAERLHLNVNYFLLGDNSGFVRAELFEESPIEVRFVEEDSVIYEQKGTFEIQFLSDQTYALTTEEGKALGTFHFGTIVQTKLGKCLVNKTEKFKSSWVQKTIQVGIQTLNEVVSDLQKKIEVESASKEGMILNLHLKGPNINKNNAILDALMEVHKENAIDEKNEVAKSTSAFINERMKFIAVELTKVEDEGQAYKSKYNLVDVTSDAASFLQKEGINEQAITNATIQQSLADFMNNYMKEHQGYTDLLPSNLGFEDASVAAHINQYNELVLNRNKILQNSSEKNPAVQKIEIQLASLKSSIATSLKNISASLQLQLKKLKAQENLYQSKIASIPQFEREYRDIIRQQQIKETLYLYLLQKREENEITLAATIGNTKIVDFAYCDGIPVSPKKKIIYLGAFLAGLLLPIGFIYLRKLINNKIQTRQELEKVGFNVLADIPLWKSEKELFALSNPNNALSEAFRLLRSGLFFVVKNENKGQVISITSTTGGEGKTFVSLNLAYLFASSGKKVALVGLDLRKPRLQKSLPLTQANGISNLMAEAELKWQDCVESIQMEGHTVDVIHSGTIPPNAGELLLNPKLDQIMEDLKAAYDLIVLDNAPVGLVADALTVNRMADVNLYVVRSGMVDKRQLDRIDQLKQGEKLKNLYFVCNGVDVHHRGYYYQYGYGAYHEKSTRTMLPKWLRFN